MSNGKCKVHDTHGIQPNHTQCIIFKAFHFAKQVRHNVQGSLHHFIDGRTGAMRAKCLVEDTIACSQVNQARLPIQVLAALNAA